MLALVTKNFFYVMAETLKCHRSCVVEYTNYTKGIHILGRIMLDFCLHTVYTTAGTVQEYVQGRYMEY